MVEALRSRRHRGLAIDFRIHADETHRSVFSTALSKGLRSVFGEQRPEAY